MKNTPIRIIFLLAMLIPAATSTSYADGEMEIEHGCEEFYHSCLASGGHVEHRCLWPGSHVYFMVCMNPTPQSSCQYYNNAPGSSC